jgi:endonuclease/exonuclease/phosphatase family metal-dependent hydrolase
VDDSLVVVSYNIQYGEKIDAALQDLTSESHLAQVDILLLQEMHPAGCERLARELGYDYVYCPAAIHPHHDRPFGNAILARGQIIDHGFIVLPRAGSPSGTTRIALVADLLLGTERLRAVSLHASTIIVSDEWRVRQVRAVLDSISALPGPMVIGGDFNTVGREDTQGVLEEMGRAGFARLTPRGNTVRSFWLKLIGSSRVLDHIFHRGLDPRRAGVYSEAEASDHYPVWAVFEWPPISTRLRP